MAKIVATLMFLAQIFSCGMIPAHAETEMETLPAFLIRQEAMEQLLRQDPDKALYGALLVSFIATRDHISGIDTEHNDFVYEEIRMFHPDGSEFAIAIEIKGKRTNSPTPWQRLEKDGNVALDGLLKYLSGLNQEAKQGGLSMRLREVTIKRGVVSKPSPPDVSPPKPPVLHQPKPSSPTPELSPPPPQFGPPPASRPDHARAPSGARLNLW